MQGTDFLRVMYDRNSSVALGYVSRMTSSLYFKKPWQRERYGYNFEENKYEEENSYATWTQYQRRLGVKDAMTRSLMFLSKVSQFS